MDLMIKDKINDPQKNHIRNKGKKAFLVVASRHESGKEHLHPTSDTPAGKDLQQAGLLEQHSLRL